MFFNSYETVDRKNVLKYGKVFGFYEGTLPILMISDPTIIKEIYITNFHLFPISLEVQSPDPMDTNMIIACSGSQWKRQRSAMSTAFTSLKVKQMYLNMKPCKDRFLEHLDGYVASGQDMHLRSAFGLHVLDVLSTVFYSLDMDIYNNPNSRFADAMRAFFNFTAFKMFVLSNSPNWVLSTFGIGLGGGDPAYLKSFIEQVAISRLEADRKRDLFQILLDSREMNGNVTDKGMTDIEIKANGVILAVAAFDTTTQAMSFICWMLALHPDVQTKVYQEIVQVLGDDISRELTFDDIQKLKYLEAVITETLRLYPVDRRSVRQCGEDTIVPGTDIEIPKGTIIHVPNTAVHYDANNYADPDEFRPERFLAENKDSVKPGTYMAFGAGPKMCLGIKFAYMNMRQTMAELVRKYTIVRSERTVDKFVSANGNLFLNAEPLFAKLQLRQSL